MRVCVCVCVGGEGGGGGGCGELWSFELWCPIIFMVEMPRT